MAERTPADVSETAEGPRAAEADVCRFCLDAGEEPLLSVCACRGSGRWVHSSCLRRWQEVVQLSVNRPEDVSSEERHVRCTACRQAFEGFEPEDRQALLSRFAAASADDLGPGCLIRYAADYPVPDFGPGSELLRVLFEAKKAHFRNSVYLLATVAPGAAPDDKSAIVGVNLTRPVPLASCGAAGRLEEYARGQLSDAEAAACRARGLKISLSFGGPVKPRALGPALLLSRSLPRGYAIGEPVELKNQGLRLAAAGGAPVELRLFAGVARWSSAQLLGEVARRSWALVAPGVCEDIAADFGSEAADLWHSLEERGRLRWAPPNPMADEYQSRISGRR